MQDLDDFIEELYESIPEESGEKLMVLWREKIE